MYAWQKNDMLRKYGKRLARLFSIRLKKGDSWLFVFCFVFHFSKTVEELRCRRIFSFEFQLKCRIVLYQAVSLREIRAFPIFQRFISLDFRLRNVRRSDGYIQLELQDKFQRVLQCVNFIFETAFLCLKKKILIKRGDCWKGRSLKKVSAYLWL